MIPCFYSYYIPTLELVTSETVPKLHQDFSDTYLLETYKMLLGDILEWMNGAIKTNKK